MDKDNLVKQGKRILSEINGNMDCTPKVGQKDL